MKRTIRIAGTLVLTALGAGLHLARYKVPKAFVRVAVVERSPSGKPDYRWAKTVATGQA